MIERIVEPELLDELAADDPRAVASRRDLRRLNALMRHGATISRVLHELFANHLSLRLVELGAGDGDFLLSVARRSRGKWRAIDAILVDQHDLVPPAIRQEFAALQWRVRAVSADAFEWLRSANETDVIVCNLFLHHFTDARLRELMKLCAERSGVVIALEPRRWRPALLVSRFVGAIGCNQVTRHDAVVSVRAGFAGQELSALWTDRAEWELIEQPIGWSSHLFIACRRHRGAPPARGRDARQIATPGAP